MSPPRQTSEAGRTVIIPTIKKKKAIAQQGGKISQLCLYNIRILDFCEIDQYFLHHRRYIL